MENIITLNMELLLKEIQKLEIISKMHYLLLSKFQNLANIFAAFDRNEDDFIDEGELKKGFLIFCNYKTEENIKLFLSYFDKDNDGRISGKEWENSTFYISNDIKRSKIHFLRSKLEKKTENENFYDYLNYYLDENNPIPPNHKDDDILKKSFNKSDFNYLMQNNESFNHYSKKASLLKFDPYFIDRKPENSIETTEISENMLLDHNFNQKPLKMDENSSLLKNNKKIGFSKEILISNEQKTFGKNSQDLDDDSRSELSFESICTKELPVNERSSEKKIREKFSSNDSFYKNMITELHSNKKADIYEEYNKIEISDKENNFIMKLYEASNDKNNSGLLKTNNSFIEKPQKIVQNSSKRTVNNNIKENVANNFENLDILTELNRRLKEKEEEIGKDLKFQRDKKNDLFLPFKLSPKKKNVNDLLIKNATDKVQKLFENIIEPKPSLSIRNQNGSVENQNNKSFLDKIKINSFYNKSNNNSHEKYENNGVFTTFSSPKNAVETKGFLNRNLNYVKKQQSGGIEEILNRNPKPFSFLKEKEYFTNFSKNFMK